jgi:hypothetical protein
MGWTEDGLGKRVQLIMRAPLFIESENSLKDFPVKAGSGTAVTLRTWTACRGDCARLVAFLDPLQSFTELDNFVLRNPRPKGAVLDAAQGNALGMNDWKPTQA